MLRRVRSWIGHPSGCRDKLSKMFKIQYLFLCSLLCQSIEVGRTYRLSGPVERLIDQSDLRDEYNRLKTFETIHSGYNSCEIFYYGLDRADQKLSLSQAKYATVVAKYRSAYYMDFLIHRYDEFDEHRASGGPLVDSDACLRDLEFLNERAARQRTLKASSKDINLYRLMDTFGRMPPGYMMGNVFWVGSYDECIKLKVDTRSGKYMKTRFCWASIRYKDWPKTGFEVIKSGVCLPKSCDSMPYRNKFDLVSNLMEYNSREIDKNATDLVDLYCLPDEESPLRLWYKSDGTFVFVVTLSLWLMLLLFCTYKFEKDRSKSEVAAGAQELAVYDTYKILAITSNFKKLFKMDRVYNSGDGFQGEALKLDMVEGLKVLGKFNIISAHALFFTSATLADVRAFGSMLSPIYMYCHMNPAFTVNIFFSISGMLSSYMLFKRNQMKPFLTSPIAWFVLICNRYIRLIVAYAFIVAYSKYLAKYTNSGPFWDYATTSLGMRRICEREPWYWTLLMIGNLKPPDEHCAAFGWYISSDFQFFALIPIFIVALSKNPKFGKFLIILVSLISAIASGYELDKIPLDHAEPVSRFAPYSFQSLLSHFKTAYTEPWYRISSYLVGVLIGHWLFEYECKRIAYTRAKEAQRFRGKGGQKLETPRLPLGLENYGGSLCLALAIWFAANSYVLKALHPAAMGAKFVTIFIIPVLHLGYATVCGIYIMLGSTGYGVSWLNRLLGARFWKPLSRMSVCALVVNIEFIQYYIQGLTQLQPLTYYNLVVVYITSIVGTYLFSSIMFILFEEPLSRLLQSKLFRASMRLESGIASKND